MSRTKRASGFSLVELLLVLAIIGIISAIAIPSFLGQRRRARMIGDAQANAQVLRMQLEAYRADTGLYGTSGVTYNWSASGGVPTQSAGVALNFTPKGNSKMNYSVLLTSGGLGYTLTVNDPTLTGTPTALTVNQAGSTVIYLK
jgi:prepilin-type N-terminal cleavage/methylation domain-containing protein